jgi:hypothetical protein
MRFLTGVPSAWKNLEAVSGAWGRACVTGLSDPCAWLDSVSEVVAAAGVRSAATEGNMQRVRASIRVTVMKPSK